MIWNKYLGDVKPELLRLQIQDDTGTQTLDNFFHRNAENCKPIYVCFPRHSMWPFCLQHITKLREYMDYFSCILVVLQSKPLQPIPQIESFTRLVIADNEFRRAFAVNPSISKLLSSINTQTFFNLTSTHVRPIVISKLLNSKAGCDHTNEQLVKCHCFRVTVRVYQSSETCT